MKKLLSIILSILMVVTMLPMAVMPASAAEEVSDGGIYCDLGPWADPTLTALILKYSDDNSTINEIVMEEVSYNIWKADVSTNNPAGWRVQFVGSNRSTYLSSIGTVIPAGKNCFRITEYNSSSGGYDGVWYQYPCTSHDYKDGICACGEVCFHANYTDGKCDVCGYECPHEWNDGVLTRPERITTTEWDDGYYTYTCTLCGAYYHEVVKRADYTIFETVMTDYIDIVNNKSVFDSVKNELSSIYQQNRDVTGGNRIETEQAAVDAVVKLLSDKIEEIKAEIEDGTAVKADYTEIDGAVADIDEALENATISEEMANELAEIKEQLETLKENEGATMADVNELLERVKAVAETMADCAKGVHSFTAYTEAQAPECGKAGKEVAFCDNGCGATDEKEIPALEHNPTSHDCRGYYCSVCRSFYGEPADHTLLEQICKGSWCTVCRKYYGEGNPDIHVDGYSSTGKRKDGCCDGCFKQLAIIKSGETYEINSDAHFVEFVPALDGRYILTIDGPAGTEFYFGEVVDGAWNGLFCEVISDLTFALDCSAGKTYRFELIHLRGYTISSITLECETHSGTEQTCYGYVCDACGVYFGEALGHDIITDEAVAPTCTETGLTEGSHCTRCDDMTVVQEIIPVLDHIDNDGDYLCDHGCGTQISSGGDGGTGETETPDGPTEDTCDRCGEVHTNFFQDFICMIKDFFNRIINFFTGLFK